MTTGSVPGQPNQIPPGLAPPPGVAAIAYQQQFGAHLASRRIPAPTGPMVGRILGAIGLFVLGFILLAVAQAIGPFGSGFWLVRMLAGASCLAAIPTLIGAIKAASAQRPDAYYVYEGGLIYSDSEQATGVPQALGWQEVRELRPVADQDGAQAGQVTRLSLVRHQGWPVTIPLDTRQGRDPFLDQLAALLRARGIPVQVS